jgi:hypothetical protein
MKQIGTRVDSRRKQFAERVQNSRGRRTVKLSERFNQAGFIHRSELIKGDFARFALESDLNACWPTAPDSGHGSNDDRGQSTIQFLRGDDDTRPGFAVSAPVAGSNRTRNIPKRSVTTPIPSGQTCLTPGEAWKAHRFFGVGGETPWASPRVVCAAGQAAGHSLMAGLPNHKAIVRLTFSAPLLSWNDNRLASGQSQYLADPGFRPHLAR